MPSIILNGKAMYNHKRSPMTIVARCLELNRKRADIRIFQLHNKQTNKTGLLIWHCGKKNWVVKNLVDNVLCHWRKIITVTMSTRMHTYRYIPIPREGCACSHANTLRMRYSGSDTGYNYLVFKVFT